MALIDLDHFKNVNDTLGHDAGDTVLASFAAHLRAGVRDRDMVGRLGGEEFVVVFPATTIESAYDVLSRLRIVADFIPVADHVQCGDRRRDRTRRG